ncbi:MAG: hypothetical protein QM690_18135 [Sphingobium sp.]
MPVLRSGGAEITGMVEQAALRRRSSVARRVVAILRGDPHGRPASPARAAPNAPACRKPRAIRP